MIEHIVPPHGGTLRPLLISGKELQQEISDAASLPVVRCTSRETSDLIMLAIGAFSPLTGFASREDYRQIVETMHLSNGTLWPVPITLSAGRQQAETLTVGETVALVDDESGELMGTMRIEDKYTYDKEKEAKHVFGTSDPAHPGVAKLFAQKDVLLGGPVKALSEGPYPDWYGTHYARPAECRALFSSKGWKTIAAFQTRNPIHRSHEYCTKIALELCDGLFIHPLVGKLKDDDIPADVRMQCYHVLLQNYYPADRTLMRVYPMEMRYAGPREALLHAIIRQNFGCSHLIVGRDHAGVGNYYGPFDAQRIFDQLKPEELYIQPLKIDWTFWCYECGGMASTKTCPHPKERRLLISGTRLREMLTNGEALAPEFSRPEVLSILQSFYQNQKGSRS
jgi:sulfate adenylyltransferase